MEQVKFLRGTSDVINSVPLTEGAFYYATDTKELLMAMDGGLVQLDNSVYWILDGEPMMLPSEINKRIAYDVMNETLYVAYLDNTWRKVGRNAFISAGTLVL